MAAFSYIALDARGTEQRGTVEVSSQHEAINRIKEMGYFPTRILQANESPTRGGPAPKLAGRLRWDRAPRWLGGDRVGRKRLTAFTRQLATLVEAGLPILRGLQLIERQEPQPVFKRILAEIQQTIEAGGTLSEALARHPRVFNRLYLSMVRAGEAGGVLETVLNRLAEFMEKAQKIRSRIAGALFYPCAVLTVASAILIVLMIWVVPQFEAVFQDMTGQAGMPVFTQTVLGISRWFQGHLLWVLGGAGAGWASLRLFSGTGVGRRLFDRLKLRVPVLGTLFRKIALARLARSLGTLLKSGVPILQALSTVKEIAGNEVFARAVMKVHDSVKEGESFAAPLEATALFPPTLLGMVDVGEQTGTLPDMLLKVADLCDEEADNAVGALTSLLEPVMIVFLALVVGSIVIAMFLPILRLIGGPGTGVETMGATDP